MTTCVGFYFKKISEKLEKRANERPNRRDVTYAQRRILWYLHTQANGAAKMTEIEKYFDCSHATVFGLVKRLAEKGLVSVCQDEQDKRAKIVFLTEKEKVHFRKMKDDRQKTEALLLGGFSEEEKKEFSAFLDRVYQNLGGCECDGEKKRKKKKEAVKND